MQIAQLVRLVEDQHLEAVLWEALEIGSRKRAMRARRGTPDEKAHYWPDLCRMYPDYADYQARTVRDIPILIPGLSKVLGGKLQSDVKGIAVVESKP